jgi:hypothetical protein
MINDIEKNLLLKKLPDLELSYEKIIHKKVFDKIDYFLLIPQGNKSILWLTHFKDKYFCITININKYNKLENLKVYSACFNKKLAHKDTIFLGYEFAIPNKNNKFFSITDILFYKGINYKDYSYEKKFNTLTYIFNNDLEQIYLNRNSLIIGLPLIIDNLKKLDEERYNCIYNLGGIIYIQNKLSSPYGISFYGINIPIYGIFQISADIQNDIYDMYIYDNNRLIYYDNLLINSYTNSVFMNNLFRNIKENNNLDLLEESDSESEFENTDQDKYVDLKKKINIKCKFNNKFKKWIPVEISKDNIINKKELYNILKK